MTEILYAFFPAIVLLIVILWVDRKQPEPLKEILLALLGGVGSIAPALFFVGVFAGFGLYDDNEGGLLGTFKISCFGAGLPEEMGKLMLLYLLVRRNKHFDEYVDGIVYAACIGLGFAAYENVLYVSGSTEMLATAMTRALFSVPGHFIFALFMGYWFSKWWWCPKRVDEYDRNADGESHKKLYLLLAILVPTICHTVYDWVCFYFEDLGGDNDFVVVLTYICLLTVNVTGFVFARKRIQRHKLADRQVEADADTTLENDYNKEKKVGRTLWGMACNVMLYSLVVVAFFMTLILPVVVDENRETVENELILEDGTDEEP